MFVLFTKGIAALIGPSAFSYEKTLYLKKLFPLSETRPYLESASFDSKEALSLVAMCKDKREVQQSLENVLCNLTKMVEHKDFFNGKQYSAISFLLDLLHFANSSEQLYDKFSDIYSKVCAVCPEIKATPLHPEVLVCLVLGYMSHNNEPKAQGYMQEYFQIKTNVLSIATTSEHTHFSCLVTYKLNHQLFLSAFTKAATLTNVRFLQLSNLWKTYLKNIVIRQRENYIRIRELILLAIIENCLQRGLFEEGLHFLAAARTARAEVKHYANHSNPELIDPQAMENQEKHAQQITLLLKCQDELEAMLSALAELQKTQDPDVSAQNALVQLFLNSAAERSSNKQLVSQNKVLYLKTVGLLLQQRHFDLLYAVAISSRLLTGKEQYSLLAILQAEPELTARIVAFKLAKHWQQFDAFVPIQESLIALDARYAIVLDIMRATASERPKITEARLIELRGLFESDQAAELKDRLSLLGFSEEEIALVPTRLAAVEEALAMARTIERVKRDYAVTTPAEIVDQLNLENIVNNPVVLEMQQQLAAAGIEREMAEQLFSYSTREQLAANGEIVVVASAISQPLALLIKKIKFAFSKERPLELLVFFYYGELCIETILNKDESLTIVKAAGKTSEFLLQALRQLAITLLNQHVHPDLCEIDAVAQLRNLEKHFNALVYPQEIKKVMWREFNVQATDSAKRMMFVDLAVEENPFEAAAFEAITDSTTKEVVLKPLSESAAKAVRDLVQVRWFKPGLRIVSKKEPLAMNSQKAVRNYVSWVLRERGEPYLEDDIDLYLLGLEIGDFIDKNLQYQGNNVFWFVPKKGFVAEGNEGKALEVMHATTFRQGFFKVVALK